MIWYVTNVDTEVLALRMAIEALPSGFDRVRAAQPWALEGGLDLEGARCVMVRLLRGRQAWEPGFDELRSECARRQIPFLAFGGEAVPDAEMTAASSVPSATVTQAFAYLVHGGPDNFEHLLRFVADTVLLEGFGFDPPYEIPEHGVWRAPAERHPERPLVGVVFYRAHLVAGNTGFVSDLCDALEAAGADALAMWCYSLRDRAAEPVLSQLGEAGIDALVTTVLASGGAAAGAGIAGGPGGLEGEAWDAAALAALDVPIIQSPSSGQSRADWEDSDAGLGPYDATAGVAVPELDGRIVAPVSAFNEVVDDGDELGLAVRAYRTVPDRVRRVAALAVRHAELGRRPVGQRKVALVLSAFPTARSRLGNAVGLDTPASVLRLLDALSEEGYSVAGRPPDGDALMGALADGLTYDAEQLTPAQRELAVGRLEVEHYVSWFAGLPEAARTELEGVWGPPPGRQRIVDGAFLFSGLECGNVLVAVQPPRGYGDDPIAVYHSPNLPPVHHYLAFYRWLDEVWGADAVVHLGKHGTLEWLPGKALALSAACWPDAALGDVPLFYPFVVNDPGEGSQAKRRAHAVIVDHLLPPMTRADTYDDLARLEQLFDEYSQLQSLDPTKLPALRARIWDLLRRASLDADLGLEGEAAPEGDQFDALILHVDGYLCELKDAQIRGGLHILGEVPAGTTLVDLVLAITRLAHGRVPSLRALVAEELGLEAGEPRTAEAVEARARALVEAAAARDWRAAADDSPTMRWVCEWLVPNLRRSSDEVANLVRGLGGRFVPAGPSGALTRGAAHVLPTGRNFYSLDPRALPTELSFEVGLALADRILERHLEESGTYPRTVGLVLWGTAMMRTQGDDVAQALALLGVRPVWEAESRRIVGLEAVPLAELGRPRIDVTLRVSGFFRDAFPNLVRMVDEAVELVAGLPEGPEDNFVIAAGTDDPRLFGPGPGSYGTGILQLLEQRNWRSDDDLAAVYMAWSGYSYSRRGYGVPAHEAMRRRFAAIEVAVKNQDNREHDIFDSDEYLQEHGGMVATIRSLTGSEPKAWFGDTADPSHPRVRSLAEEAARVVRTRVVNPKWIQAMQRHGYKGAFEMAATVDYLFGYDATARVVADWMYERVTESYVADPQVRKFFEESNPWALTSITERLWEAAQRGLWDASPEALATLRDAMLEAEGWEEGR